jgi:hypothetical protein
LTPTAPSCPGGVYTVHAGSQTLSFIGDGSTDAYQFSFTVTNAESTICLYGTSQVSSKSGSFADTAPDTACSDTSTYLQLNPSGGGASGFN